MPREVSLNVSGYTQVDVDEFHARSGRQLYEELSFTNLNRIPIQKLMSGVLAHLTVKADILNLPDPKDICERLLVEGSIALAEGVPIEDLEFVSDTRVIQYVSGNRDINENGNYTLDQKRPLIVWDTQLNEEGTKWAGRKVKFFGSQDSEGEMYPEEVLDTKTFDVSLLLPFPNGRGVLYHPQRLYRRLEMIAATLERNTAKDRLKAFILGLAGGQAKIKQLIASGEEYIALEATDIKTVVNTELSSRLMEEFEMMKPLYLEATYVVQMIESVQSGVAKAIDMMPYSNKVKETQNQMLEIYGLFKDLPKDALTFSNPPTQSVDERSKEYELLEKMEANRDITADERKDKSRRLI